MTGQALTFRELQEKIATRAWEDPAFEAEFVADPKGTFEKYTGRPLPADLRILAHYNTPNEIHFVIPRPPESAGDELTDEDLERVAGGETILLFTAATISAFVATETLINQGW